jgi:GcrA cell cycle regulator
MATNNSWSAATIAKLRLLFERGLSTAEIGKRLGFTKNAIVGKINRLGLNTKVPVKSEKKKAAPKKSPPKKSVKAAGGPSKNKKNQQRSSAESRHKIERVIQHSAALMSLRPDQCRWPIGDPDSDNFRFCGEKCFVGKPYCFEHCKLAYQFTAPVKKK